MTNETTASQPKSIGDDAQFRELILGWKFADSQEEADIAYRKAIEHLESRPPAAQASGPIQFLHNVCADVLLALRNCDRQPLADMLESALHDLPASATIQAAPRVPTEEMQNAARDWAVKKYGIGIGKDAALGCWQAMWDAAAIQEPVMVAEPVREALEAARYALKHASSLYSCGFNVRHAQSSMNGIDDTGVSAQEYEAAAEDIRTAVSKARDLVRKAIAAPMVADPAGVAWDYATMGIPNEEIIDMWRAAGHSGTVPFSFANRIQERMQASLVATVKAVPSEALDTGPFTLEQRMPPKGEEVLIYFAGSNGKMECRIDEWDDLHEDPIGMGGPAICVGEGWVSYYEDNVTHWAPIPAVNFAAPLADKTGGVEHG